MHLSSPSLSSVSSQTDSTFTNIGMDRSEEFYFAPLVEFQVDGKLFCVPREGFMQSSTFSDLYEITPQVKKQATIVIDSVEASEFTAFLKLLIRLPLGLKEHELCEPDLEAALKLSSLWDFDAIRASAISRLEALSLEPPRIIQLAQLYSVDCWIAPEIERLAFRPKSLTFEEAEQVGLKTVVEIYTHRDTLSRLFNEVIQEHVTVADMTRARERISTDVKKLRERLIISDPSSPSSIAASIVPSITHQPSESYPLRNAQHMKETDEDSIGEDCSDVSASAISPPGRERLGIPRGLHPGRQMIPLPSSKATSRRTHSRAPSAVAEPVALPTTTPSVTRSTRSTASAKKSGGWFSGWNAVAQENPEEEGVRFIPPHPDTGTTAADFWNAASQPVEPLAIDPPVEEKIPTPQAPIPVLEPEPEPVPEPEPIANTVSIATSKAKAKVKGRAVQKAEEEARRREEEEADRRRQEEEHEAAAEQARIAEEEQAAAAAEQARIAEEEAAAAAEAERRKQEEEEALEAEQRALEEEERQLLAEQERFNQAEAERIRREEEAAAADEEQQRIAYDAAAAKEAKLKAKEEARAQAQAQAEAEERALQEAADAKAAEEAAAVTAAAEAEAAAAAAAPQAGDADAEGDVEDEEFLKLEAEAKKAEEELEKAQAELDKAEASLAKIPAPKAKIKGRKPVATPAQKAAERNVAEAETKVKRAKEKLEKAEKALQEYEPLERAPPAPPSKAASVVPLPSKAPSATGGPPSKAPSVVPISKQPSLFDAPPAFQTGDQDDFYEEPLAPPPVSKNKKKSLLDDVDMGSSGDSNDRAGDNLGLWSGGGSGGGGPGGWGGFANANEKSNSNNNKDGGWGFSSFLGDKGKSGGWGF